MVSGVVFMGLGSECKLKLAKSYGVDGDARLLIESDAWRRDATSVDVGVDEPVLNEAGGERDVLALLATGSAIFGVG